MKRKFKVSGMHCTSCAMTIEWELEDKGIKSKCDYAKQTLNVEFEPGNKNSIIELVTTLGYQLSEVNEDL